MGRGEEAEQERSCQPRKEVQPKRPRNDFAKIAVIYVDQVGGRGSEAQTLGGRNLEKGSRMGRVERSHMY